MGTFFYEFVRVGVYKRSQGRITRQITFAGLAVTLALGVLRFSSLMAGKGPAFQFALPGVLLAISLWGSFRLVNFPGFADFLIAVEAEMNKVSWPTRTELFRASMVVLIMIFSLAAVLFVYDISWGAFVRKFVLS